MNISSDGYVEPKGSQSGHFLLEFCSVTAAGWDVAEEPRTPAESAHRAVLESTGADMEGNKEPRGGGGGREAGVGDET